MVRWINLNRARERRLSFEKYNGGISGTPNIDWDWDRFEGIDGAVQERQLLVEQGLITRTLAQICDSRNLGCSLSHQALWRYTLGEGEPVTICEDDAVFNKDFVALAEQMMYSLEFDILFWGWNFNSALLIDILPGVSAAAVCCDQRTLQNSLSRFQELSITPIPYKLTRAFGTVAYTLTPYAAKYLLESCIPLRHVGIDIEIGHHLSGLQAYVSVPPLVATPNYR